MRVHEVNLGFVKSFILDTEEGLVIVDAGLKGSGERILKALDNLGRKREEVKYVVFTHSHGDHIGGASELRKSLNAKFGIEDEGKKSLEEGRAREPVVHSLGLKLLFSLGRPFFFKSLEPVKVDFALKEGELVKGVEVLKTPGHTKDSVSFYLPELNAVIVGDTLQGTRRGLKLPAIYEDYSSLWKSVERIKSLKPSMVYVSHGPSSSTFLI
uniref:Beta-lactamase n=1 Tax=Candidatus Aramenus sulfurataquae TaxID=1326980 RepID=A0A0F2LK11_9CREN